ncbi:hypothetical protein FA15DRAFT_673104 [Coprinopsis marcescibilis]|uniref:Uncharacterized protein n=1 Tax=Coprinopsis marcescibilis TaxID=230819 RepID=A0A5C3KKW9_COPMA|nr:hypothetical protein FA15DRAFT_673104 [Coprinopsis marcescibilis]
MQDLTQPLHLIQQQIPPPHHNLILRTLFARPPRLNHPIHFINPRMDPTRRYKSR